MSEEMNKSSDQNLKEVSGGVIPRKVAHPCEWKGDHWEYCDHPNHVLAFKVFGVKAYCCTYCKSEWMEKKGKIKQHAIG